MKSLKNLIALSSNVKIYVPSTIDVDKSIENSYQVKHSLIFLTNQFGGATSFEALGCWLTQGGSMIRERVTICQSFCSEENLLKNIDNVHEFCLNLKKGMNQEAISLEVNNVLYFI